MSSKLCKNLMFPKKDYSPIVVVTKCTISRQAARANDCHVSNTITARGVIRGKAAKHLPQAKFETLTVILYFCLARFKSYLITKNYQTVFMEEGVNDWKNAHSKFCWHEKSSIHIEAVSKLLENRNEKDISQNTNIQFCRYKIIFPWL